MSRPRQGAALGHALDLGDGRLERVVGDRREPAEPLRVLAAEVGEPLVVDPHHLDGGLGIVHASGRAEHPVEHLGLHAVPVLVLDPEVGVGEAADALLAVGVEAGLLHAIRAVDAARDVLPPRRAHAVDASERGALLGGPRGTAGPVRHVGHPVPHRRRRARGEQVGREPAEVDVAVRGDGLVSHRRSLLPWPGGRVRGIARCPDAITPCPALADAAGHFRTRPGYVGRARRLWVRRQ